MNNKCSIYNPFQDLHRYAVTDNGGSMISQKLKYFYSLIKILYRMVFSTKHCKTKPTTKLHKSEAIVYYIALLMINCGICLHVGIMTYLYHTVYNILVIGMIK